MTIAPQPCADHPYGGRDASRTVETLYGRFHVCLTCSVHMHAAGLVISDRPLYDTDNRRQRCQCEHVSHMAAKGA